jgi:hypothetical protein
MNTSDQVISPNSSPAIPNGSGAAAILSAGVGSFALAVLALASDKSAPLRGILIFYRPTGPLSGVTTVAILLWFLTWAILEWRWRGRTVAVQRINAVSFVLLGLSLLLTFPLIGDLL